MSVSSRPIARTGPKPEKALAFGQNAFQPQINNRQHLFGSPEVEDWAYWGKNSWKVNFNCIANEGKINIFAKVFVWSLALKKEIQTKSGGNCFLYKQ